jgi:hypothetical protein
MSQQNNNDGTPEDPNASEMIEQLKGWTWRYFQLMAHSHLVLRIELGLDGKENTFVTGLRGTGKTQAIEYYTAQIQAREVTQAPPGAMPRQILSYTTAPARGAKTVLTDLADAVGLPVSSSLQRSGTPRQDAKPPTNRCRHRDCQRRFADVPLLTVECPGLGEQPFRSLPPSLTVQGAGLEAEADFSSWP